MVGELMTDLIRKFVEIGLKYSDIPESYLESGGYYIVSDLLGRYFILPNIKFRRLNTWFILSSIPARMRRSTCLAYVDKAVFESMKEYGRRALGGEDKGIELYGLSQIEDGSPEGIFDAIIEGKESGVTNFRISSTEMGATLKKIQFGAGSYKSGVDQVFSKL